MAEFGFDIGKNQGLPKLPDNYWKEQKSDEKHEINTIFDENLNVSLKDLPFIFGKRN